MDSFRCVLEMLKFLEAKDILHSSTTNRCFAKASQSQELWSFLCDDLSFPNDLEEFPTYQLCYAQFIRHRCKIAFLDPMPVVFNAVTESWARVPTLSLLQVAWNTVCVVLNDGNLFLCGGGSGSFSKTCFILDLTTREIERLPEMYKMRAGHGLALYRDVVYVFGGAHSANTCEKLSSKQWNSMRDMQGLHSWFSPVRVGSKVFLCGGDPDGLCEQFDTETELCQGLGIRLSGYRSETCVLVHNEELIILQKESLVVWNIEQEAEVRRGAHSNLGSIMTHMSPVVVRQKAYIPKMDSLAVVVLDLQSFEVTQLLVFADQQQFLLNPA